MSIELTPKRIIPHSENELCSFLKAHEVYGRIYLDAKFLPSPFFVNSNEVKAVVLGADPSNPQGKFFEKVFGLESSNKSPYFRGIKQNLIEVGLNLSDIYVQNLCRNYFKLVTDENPYWNDIASLWLPQLKSELDGLFESRIPVFLTAGKLHRLLYPKYGSHGFRHAYQNKEFVSESENILERVLIPFFRHPAYDLRRWPEYAQTIKCRWFSEKR